MNSSGLEREKKMKKKKKEKNKKQHIYRYKKHFWTRKIKIRSFFRLKKTMTQSKTEQLKILRSFLSIKTKIIAN